MYKDDQLVGEIFYVYGSKKSFKYYFPNGVISETLEKSTYRKYNDKGVLVIENLYGEYIKKYNDKELTGKNTLSKYISASKVGDKIDLIVDRDGKDISITVTLGESPQNSQ